MQASAATVDSASEDVELQIPEDGQLGLDEAMVLASRLHRLGELQAALELYERVIAAAPEHADAMHFSGIAHHQLGDSARGLEMIERSIVAAPDNPAAHLNRGNVLLSLARFDDAHAAYIRAAECGCNTVELNNNLGVLNRALGRTEEALEHYRRALLVDPDYADTHSNLAGLYSACGRIEDAVRHGCLALVSQPYHPAARKLVAMGYHTLGRLDEAAQIYREWLAEEPDNPLPRHYLAACTGVDVPARATDAYVQATFDGFAGSFDAKLAKLTYRAPELIAQAIGRRMDAPDQSLDVLDIGCGTGLCGPYLRPYAKTLCGVDLSANMLAKAEARGLYDALVQAELTDFLAGKHDAYDLLASADTFCYFGDLHGVIAAAHGALRPGGLIAFTVEASPDTAATPFTLHPHGRYSHQREYVQRALASAGFTRIDMQAEPLRNESGRPVQGWLVSAHRAGDNAMPQR